MLMEMKVKEMEQMKKKTHMLKQMIDLKNLKSKLKQLIKMKKTMVMTIWMTL